MKKKLRCFSKDKAAEPASVGCFSCSFFLVDDKARLEFRRDVEGNLVRMRPVAPPVQGAHDASGKLSNFSKGSHHPALKAAASTGRPLRTDGPTERSFRQNR